MSVALGGHARVRKAGGGAGGGGLDAGDYLYFHDTSGNVGQLVAWATGYGGAQGDEWHVDRLVARYEYDPYGRIMTQSGFYAAANPFRWSTKRLDPETELSDFGRRYYSATLGRWLNRDPIGDFGGANVYAYVGNNPTNRTDYLGMMYIPCPPGEPCDDEGSSSSGPPSQEENDKKPCPGKPDLYQQSQPSQPTPPGVPETPPDFCDDFCAQYSDKYENAACRAGCDAGRHGLPTDPTCEIMGSQYGAKAQEACERGHEKGQRPLPPAPFTPFGPNCSRGDCMTAVGIAGAACEAACITGCALTGPFYGFCVAGCSTACLGASAYTGIADCLRCPNP